MPDLEPVLDEMFPSLVEDLMTLVRIPSVSAPDFDQEPVRRSAEATARLLEDAGYQGVRLLEVDGVAPAVFGTIEGPEGAPTVLLYAHHDVQPPGPADAWTTPAFEPEERDGRLYGRGTADDKCGVVTHVAMGRLFGDRPPVTIKVFVEGEEEIGSANLERFLEAHRSLLAADVIVIADSENWRVGQPAITTSLRGLISVRLEVETHESGIHSGVFGGAVPDALTILCRILATLHDDAGAVAVPGLVTGDTEPLDLTEDELREQAGMLPGTALLGGGALTARLWKRPAAAVLAIDAPPLSEAINQLVPKAGAKVSVRIAPGDDPETAMQALIDHLTSQPAWGARVTATPLESAQPFAARSDDPRLEAFRTAMARVWDHPPVDIGSGGTIPFVAAFAESYPEAAIVMTGACDPTSAIHGPDESVDLAELRNSILAQAIALANVAKSS